MTILFLSDLMLTNGYEEINTLFHQIGLQTAEILMLKDLKNGLLAILPMFRHLLVSKSQPF